MPGSTPVGRSRRVPFLVAAMPVNNLMLRRAEMSSVLQDLTRLRDARLKQERTLLKVAASASKCGACTLPVPDLLRLETIHDEIEELHELILMWLYKNKPQA